ncbi:MAG: NTPase [Thermoplasmata archaeon]
MARSLKIGISGTLGIGKTDTLKRIIDMLGEEGISVGGMLTDPIFEDNRQVGFQVMDWSTKEKGVFAHLFIDTSLEVNGYNVDLDTLEQVGVKAIERACVQEDVVLVDEAGKMMVKSDKFNKTVKNALNMDKPVILTFHKKSRNPLLQDVRRRDDIRILELTEVNKDLLPYKVVELIKGEIKT